MSDSKQRAVSFKSFLRSISAARSAVAFIEQHRHYLTTGELAPLTGNIVAEVDARRMPATPALKEIEAAIYSHMMAQDLLKAEASLSSPDKAPKETKPFTVRVFTAEGDLIMKESENGELKEMEQGFDLPQRANDWADRRLLNDAPPGSYAEVTWHKCPEKMANFRVRRIERDSAFERQFKEGRTPVCSSPKKGSGGLGFGMKVRNDVAHFSKG